MFMAQSPLGRGGCCEKALPPPSSTAAAVARLLRRNEGVLFRGTFPHPELKAAITPAFADQPQDAVAIRTAQPDFAVFTTFLWGGAAQLIIAAIQANQSVRVR
jgi:hypothetical protein